MYKKILEIHVVAKKGENSNPTIIQYISNEEMQEDYDTIIDKFIKSYTIKAINIPMNKKNIYSILLCLFFKIKQRLLFFSINIFV